MPLVMLYASRAIEKDAGGHRAGSVVYRADGANTAQAALTMFDQTPGAKIHPDDPSLIFDRVSAQPSPTGVEYRITVMFSTFRGGRLAASPPVEDPAWYMWDRSRRRVRLQIPMNVRERRVPDTEGSSPFWVWALRTFEVEEVRPQRILRRRLFVAAQSVFNPIDDNIGAIHKMPNGMYAQLVDAATRQIDATHWDVEYTWEIDRGTRREIVESETIRVPPWSPDSVLLPIAVQTEHIRPPFGQYIGTVVPADPRSTLFGVVLSLVGPLREDDWRSMPGTEVV